MAFDPNAFLKTYSAPQSQPPAKPAGTGFDPNAFLQQTAPQQTPAGPEISKAASFGRGILQGGTFGFADELSGAIESAAGSLGLTDVDKTYEQARDESRANFDAAQKANPMSSLAGNVGGSIATAAFTPGMGAAGQLLSKVPGVGAALGGSRLAQAATLGAGLGAVQGAGVSTADTAGGVLSDAGEGALVGGIAGGATEAAMIGGGWAARRAGKFLRESFEPTTQRLEAIGATPASISKAGGFQKAAESIDEFTRRGGFNAVGDSPVTQVTMRDALYSQLDDVAGQMHQLMDGQAFPRVSDDEILTKLADPLLEKIYTALPGERPAASEVVQDILDKIAEDGGDLNKLWELKKYIGSKVSWANNNMNQAPPLVKQVYRDANGLLDGIVQKQLELAQQSIGGTPGKTLGELNETYSKLVKLRPILEQSADKFLLKGDTAANVRISEQIKGAALGAAAGSMIGVPGLGTAAGAMTAVGGAAMRSTSGRLARAKVGEMMGLSARGTAQKAATDAAAQAAGLIPRTLDGARQWMQQNAELVAQMPGMGAIAEQIAKLPDPAAEVLVRATLPLVQQFVAPSPYQSEFNGKISSPADRVTARQVILAQGLPPSIAAYHLSVLNKSGTLQPYHYAKQEADYGDDILNFNQRLTQMGY